MKSKIVQLMYYATCTLAVLLLAALPGRIVAQKNSPPLHPQLQGIATAGSTANWIKFREGFKINPTTIFTDYKDGFQLSDNDEMKLVKATTDNIGFMRYRYQQYCNEKKVMYGEYFVHQTKEGFVHAANGRIITGITAQASASLPVQQGLERALQFVGARKYLWQNEALEKDLKKREKNESATYYPQGELVYAPTNTDASFVGKDYKLAWHYKIYTDDKDVTAKSVFVDAVSGQVIHSYDIAMNCVTGATGTSAFNGSVTFNTWVNSTPTYYSFNDCQATWIYTFNCGGGGPVNNYYTDADNAWTLASQQSAVQAQWGALMTYNYYIGQHSRASWDNANGDMIAYNNAYAGENNACWGCTGNSTIYYAGSTSAATDDWNPNDIMGHEFTHGVVQAAAGLVYNKESGALNESFADIFGEMVESWSEGDCDYLVGGDRGAIRSFINPNAYGQPDTYLGTNWYPTVGCTPSGPNDNCGVHTNSGVQNKWFQLLSDGGTGTTDFGVAYSVTGITRFKARLIAYRALEVYLTSSSQYIDARQASLQAAFDIYGQCSPEIIAVGNAWQAVGVESQSGAFAFTVCGTVSTGGYNSPSTQAISVLTGGGSCTNTVTSPTDIRYYAARDRVILSSGFLAQQGSRFVAYTEPCSVTRWRGDGSDDNDGGVVKSDPEKGIMPSAFLARQSAPVMSPAEQAGISVVPNPFKTRFEITINAAQDAKAQVRVYNSLGVSVMEKANINVAKGTNKVSFDGSNLSKGTYLVEIYKGGVKTVKKIVKL